MTALGPLPWLPDHSAQYVHALATATRRDILRRTLIQEQSVSTLAADYDMSFAAVQKHVAVLEAAQQSGLRGGDGARARRAVPSREVG